MNTISLNRRKLLSVIASNKSVFIGISDEFNKFLKSIPNSCPSCVYNKYSNTFDPLIDANKSEVQNRCFLIFRAEVKIL